MKPTITQGIAILRPQGFLDGSNMPAILNIQDMEYVRSLDIHGFLISLKQVISFNYNAIDFVVRILNDLRAKKDIPVGLCDYDDRKYEMLLKHLGHEPTLALFETDDVARLFLARCCDHKKIFLYHPNAAQKGLMLLTLHERGYNPTVARDEEEFRKKSSDYEITIGRSYLGSAGSTIASYIRGNIVVYTLSGYLDGDISAHFDMRGFRNSLMVGFKLFVFECSMTSGMNVHAVNFFCRLATESAEYGVMIVLTGLTTERVPEKFLMDMTDVGIVQLSSLDKMMDDKDLMEHAASGDTTRHIKVRSLTKDAVELVPSFVESTIETLEVMTGVKASKKGVTIDTVTLGDYEGDFVASSMGFYGDADGMIVLILQKKIALKACKLLLQDESDLDEETVLDALGEIVNIIAGKTKTRLVNKNTRMSITLPRTFKNLHDLQGVVNAKKGAKVEFSFDGRPFVFFLTR